ncbi:hypothetical protein [Mycobacterium nebraskense]|nr:hypothetical protein [Mycobacterium nebraskense]MCV7118652.1 hypothetical protein [Mycobacterium nebraskense]
MTARSAPGWSDGTVQLSRWALVGRIPAGRTCLAPSVHYSGESLTVALSG